MRLFRRRRRQRIADLLNAAYNGSDKPVLLERTSEFDDEYVAFRYATSHFDVAIAKQGNAVTVEVGARTPEGELVRRYYFEDVRTALGDDDVPAVPPKDLNDVISLLAQLDLRLVNLFSDRSESKLKIALQNRVALRRIELERWARGSS